MQPVDKLTDLYVMTTKPIFRIIRLILCFSTAVDVTVHRQLLGLIVRVLRGQASTLKTRI